MKMSIALLLSLILCLGTSLSSATPLEEARARWNEPQLVKRFNDGIERNRKGDVVVEVVDEEGRPVPDAKVTAVQTSHAFLFGANLFVLGQLETPEMNAKFEKAFTGIFNFASLPFYWKDLEPQAGALRFTEDAPYIWRRPPPDALLAWCKTNGITPKGHPLLWHSINPDWMPNEPEELRAAYVKRFGEIADRYADEIAIWDVVNESMVCPPTYPLHSPNLDYVPWAFEEAHKIFSDTNLLMINEVTTVSHQPLDRNRYLLQVKALLEQGCQIEGIGFQFHFFSRDALDKGLVENAPMEPARLLDVYEAFSEFGLPLYITEITIPGSGPNGPAIQAEFVSSLYRLWFSVEEMAGITWWNLPDNAAYGSENSALGGLLDENMNPKPAYEALNSLINHEWKTRFEGVTDEEGLCAFRGFAGTYDIKVVTPAGATLQSRQDIRGKVANRCLMVPTK